MYWHMRCCVEFEKNKNAFQINKRLFYSTCTHTHTHTHTHTTNVTTDDDFSNVKVRMTMNDARCSVVIEHLAPGETSATDVVTLSLGYDKRVRVV